MKLLVPMGTIAVARPCTAAGSEEVALHWIVDGLKLTAPATRKSSGALVPLGVETVSLYVVEADSDDGTAPTMKMFCQSLFAKSTAAVAATAPLDLSRKSTEYEPAGAVARSPKLLPSRMNRLFTVPLPARPPLTSVVMGAAIVKARGNVFEPPPGFVTVTSKTVPGAARFAATSGTATSRLVAENAVTAAVKAAPPEEGVKVTAGFTAVAPEPDCTNPEPATATSVATVPVFGVSDVIVGAGLLLLPPQPTVAATTIAAS